MRSVLLLAAAILLAAGLFNWYESHKDEAEDRELAIPADLGLVASIV
ncbi:hypothetical protein [Terriglobus albidus]|nr:hypothetical protein [Terriglobus albidus]